MFNRLFPLKRHNSPHVCDPNNVRTQHPRKNGSQKFDKSKIRLVILADSDSRRIPFFDSDAIKPVEDHVEKKPRFLKSAPKDVNKTHGFSSSNDSGHSPKDGPKYRFERLGSDVKVLEEMMFGTVPMAYKGFSLKVHVLRSPHKLMITKVFVPEKPKGDSFSDVESDSWSLVNSVVDFSSGESFSRKYKSNKSKPMDVPTAELSDYSTDDDIGFASFTSSGSFPSNSFPSPSNNSISSYSSLHKRWMRSQTTSFNSYQRKYSMESSSSSGGSGKRGRRQKLAIAILFGSHDEKDDEAISLFQSFVFSHFTLIESHVEKLRAVIEKSYFNWKTFLARTIEAFEQFRQDVYNLYMAPRLPEPVWLTMMSSSMYRPTLCENFMKEFNSLVTHFDKKDCKFFVSTLLSAVLTQHLTWVATVTPAGGSPTKTYLEKHSAKWVETLAKTHPYNPLWAQLGDIFGAIGPPLKISRTIVVGKKADLVKRFLYILSYFIRCSDVHERDNPCNLRQVLNDPPVEESLSPTVSEKTMTNGYSSDDRNSLQSPICSRQASCSSSGTGIFSGSHGGGGSGDVVINAMTAVPSSAAEISCSDQTTVNTHDKEPSIVYCDKSLKEKIPNKNNSFKQNVIKDSVVLEGVDKPLVEPQPPNGKLRYLPGLRLNIPDISSASSVQMGNRLEAGKENLVPGVNIKPLDDLSNGNDSVNRISPPSSSDKLANRTQKSTDCDSNNLVFSDLHTFSPSSVPVCSLTPLHGPKSPVVEQVQHVGKQPSNHHSEDPVVLRSQSFSEGGRPKSKLSQQLEVNSPPVVDGITRSNSSCSSSSSRPTAAELRKLYCDGGTSSMFDEYYETTETDAKTIEDHHPPPPNSCALSSSSSGGDSFKDKVGGVPAAGCDIKSSLVRQLSYQDNSKLLSSKPPPGLKNCKSVTPELSRRRHLSSTSSLDYDTYDPLTHGREVKLPTVFSESSQFSVQTFDRNFGRSLLAGYSEKYLSDFVLLGTSDKDFKQKLLDDLQTMVQNSFLDEHIEEATCVIADTDSWTVEVATSKIMKSSPSGCTTWNYSKLVADLIESVVGIYKLKMSPEFCLMHLEDRLQEIYFKSFMFAEYLQDSDRFSHQELTSMLGFENSDMSLLFAVAGTHTPSLLTAS